MMAARGRSGIRRAARASPSAAPAGCGSRRGRGSSSPAAHGCRIQATPRSEVDRAAVTRERDAAAPAESATTRTAAPAASRTARFGRRLRHARRLIALDVQNVDCGPGAFSACRHRARRRRRR